MIFTLSDDIYKHNMASMEQLTKELARIARGGGTENPKFKAAWDKLYTHISKNHFANFNIDNRFDVRALSIALTAGVNLRRAITINQHLLSQVSNAVPKGSTLFIESLFQFFLSDFDSIKDPDEIGAWLHAERKRKGLSSELDKDILRADGPVFLAKQAITRHTAFEQQIQNAGLDSYASGDFVKRAQTIYFVEQLKSIPVNQPHDLLEEISQESVAGSRYDESQLIGHVALKILIERAPSQNVSESWQNAVIAIGGDPRVPANHPRYLKWWAHLPSEHIHKVQGWLSKLDLKLFLEALEDYSKSSRDSDMMRMFPARKYFLEGMHEAGTIVNTKLYLSRKAAAYIKRNYRPEHVPDFSIVKNGDRSIIYARLTNGHMIEGSHNCQIWFYKNLHESAPVLKYGKQQLDYEDLTGSLNRRMAQFGCEAYEHFTHVSSETYNWQKKSVTALREMGVKIKASDVLGEDDYRKYKRLYGVG